MQAAEPVSNSNFAHGEAAKQPKELRASGLVKRYGRRTVVNGVDLVLRQGEIVALLGPNGAGKTTSFYMIVGFVRPNAGTIDLAGHNITSYPMYKRASLGLGYLAQEPSAFRRLSAKENLLAILEFQDLSVEEQHRRAESLLDEFHIGHLADHRADTLSGGERRRLEIARSLAIDPDFLLLDEPFTGMNPEETRHMMDLMRRLKDGGMSILIVEHDMQAIMGLCDRITCMSFGKLLAEGNPSEIRNHPAVIEAYLGGARHVA